MATYNVSDLAEADLDEIWLYLDTQAGEEVADRQLEQLHQRFELLAEQRFLGRPRSGLAPELRSYVSRPYVIFYYPRDYGVEILRVVHGSRRISNIFR